MITQERIYVYKLANVLKVLFVKDRDLESFIIQYKVNNKHEIKDLGSFIVNYQPQIPEDNTIDFIISEIYNWSIAEIYKPIDKSDNYKTKGHNIYSEPKRTNKDIGIAMLADSEYPLIINPDIPSRPPNK